MREHGRHRGRLRGGLVESPYLRRRRSASDRMLHFELHRRRGVTRVGAQRQHDTDHCVGGVVSQREMQEIGRPLPPERFALDGRRADFERRRYPLRHRPVVDRPTLGLSRIHDV